MELGCEMEAPQFNIPARFPQPAATAELMASWFKYLLFTRRLLPEPLDGLEAKLRRGPPELQGIEKRRQQREHRQCNKAIQPIRKVLEGLRQVLLSDLGADSAAFVFGSSLRRPREVYVWQLRGNLANPCTEPLAPADAAALGRAFTRWLMSACSDVWDCVAPTPGPMFVLLRAPRGLHHEALVPRDRCEESIIKARTQTVMGVGSQGCNIDKDDADTKDMMWYQVGKQCKPWTSSCT